MQKVTAKQVNAINVLMLNTIKNYIANYVTSELADTIYADDIAYNASALQTFNATLDCNELQDAIMLQDTLVREEFINVLLYLENNNLVSITVCKANI